MNKYEERAQKDRYGSFRTAMMLLTIGLAVTVLGLILLGNSAVAPRSFWSKAVVTLCVILLIIRQVSRRIGPKQSQRRAAQPDPQSRLNLQ